jgi:hypothetical protein
VVSDDDNVGGNVGSRRHGGHGEALRADGGWRMADGGWRMAEMAEMARAFQLRSKIDLTGGTPVLHFFWGWAGRPHSLRGGGAAMMGGGADEDIGVPTLSRGAKGQRRGVTWKGPESVAERRADGGQAVSDDENIGEEGWLTDARWARWFREERGKRCVRCVRCGAVRDRLLKGGGGFSFRFSENLKGDWLRRVGLWAGSGVCCGRVVS